MVSTSGNSVCSVPWWNGNIYVVSQKTKMEVINSLFPEMTSLQKDQIAMLGPQYTAWNEKINLISRKDIEHLYEHHVNHSLALAKYYHFKPGSTVIDVGTGGGFPGIPLAIIFPKTQFILLDATAKKINVVNNIIASLKLENVTTIHSRVEDHRGVYDIIVCRAVGSIKQLIEWTKHLTSVNRWIFLKGGNQKELRKELPPIYKMRFVPVNDYLPGEYFFEKWIIDIHKPS